MVSNGASTCMKKGTKSRRVNYTLKYKQASNFTTIAVDAPLTGRCAPGKINVITANIDVPYFSVGRRALRVLPTYKLA